MTDAELAELLRTVIARPDDIDVLSVYADVLIERGDPRGELIVLQLQRRTADSQDLRNREAQLAAYLDTQIATDLGHVNTAFAWHRGFIDAVDFAPDTHRRALGDAIRMLGTLPAARQLRRIVIRFLPPGWGSIGPVISALTKVAPQLRSLRELVFTGSDRGGGNLQSDLVSLGDLSHLCRALPKLEVLELPLWDYSTIRDVSLPSLRRLVLESPRSLQNAFWMPRLEELEIWHGRWGAEWEFQGLFNHGSLRHFLAASTEAARLVMLARAMPAAHVFERMNTFALVGAMLPRDGIEALRAHAPVLKRLDKLVIEETRDARLLVDVLGDIVQFA